MSFLNWSYHPAWVLFRLSETRRLPALMVITCFQIEARWPLSYLIWLLLPARMPGLGTPRYDMHETAGGVSGDFSCIWQLSGDLAGFNSAIGEMAAIIWVRTLLSAPPTAPRLTTGHQHHWEIGLAYRFLATKMQHKSLKKDLSWLIRHNENFLFWNERPMSITTYLFRNVIRSTYPSRDLLFSHKRCGQTHPEQW